ncbi:MAG: DUF2244 domain-containing protein [Methylocystis sp.]|nr:DUF2244 domain-containing protein [Methylocystis sp.]
MTAAAPLEEHILTRRLVPYRSLTPHAFHCFIVIFGLITFLFSLPFFFIGAWPVAGFMGLDVLGLYIAFRANFRSARAFLGPDQKAELARDLTHALAYARRGARFA